MDIDSIIMAKKFSGSSAAARAEAAATRAENAATNIPDDFTDVLTQMTTFQNNLATVQAGQTSVSNRMTTVENTVSSMNTSVNNAVATANAAAAAVTQAQSAELTFTNTGHPGDMIRANGDGTYFYGARPVTLLTRFTIINDPATDMSDVTWIANGNNQVTGFEITKTDDGATISSLNMTKCLITVTNVVNTMTLDPTTQGTALWDIRYSTSTQEDRNYHGTMYHNLDYTNLHQLCYELGVNPAGTAYCALETGTSTVSGQMFPGGANVVMPTKYCLFNGVTKINAITMRLLIGAFRPDTVVRVWRIE